MTTYSQKLKDPRWIELRLRVLERDNRTCQSCKDGAENLHVHHLRYSGDPWESPMEDLVTLCEMCHDNVELAIKMLRENAHINVLPFIVNRTVLLNELDPKLAGKLLKISVKLCGELKKSDD